MTKQHKEIETPQRHNIKGFEEAPVNTFHTKNTQGVVEWVDLDTLGGNPNSHATRHLPETGGDKLPTVEPQTLGETNQVGNSDNFVRGNHVHAHGEQTLGNMHEVSTQAKHGFMSKEDKLRLDNIEDNATRDQTDAEIKLAYENNNNTNEFNDTEKSKLGGIEDNATRDLTDAEVKAKYESNSNTNEFSDAEKTKLSSIEAGGEVNQTDAQIKVQYENNANTNEYDDAEKVKLAGIETNATQDQTSAQIKASYESNSNTNEFNDAEKLKVAGFEAGAEVNQTDAEIKVQYESNSNTNGFTDAEKSKLASLETSKFLGEYASLTALQNAHPSPVVGSYGNVDLGVGQNVTKYLWDNDDNIYVAQLGDSTILTDAQIKTQYENNADTNAFNDAEKSKLSFIEAGAEVNQDNAEIKAQYEANANTNAYDDAAVTKLASIETGAEVNQDNTEIKAQYEVNPNTNAFTDSNLDKLNNIAAGAEVNQTDLTIKNQYENNADTNEFNDAEKTKLGTVETNAQENQTNAEIKVQYEANANTNEFNDTEKSKLGGIEDNATRDQTALEIKTQYESNANTNEFNDAEKLFLSKQDVGFLQYTNSVNVTTTQDYPLFTAVSLNTDNDSFPNGLLTKVSNTNFRVDFDGYVEVSVRGNAQCLSGNDRSYGFGVVLNNAILPYTVCRGSSKTNNNRYYGVAGTFVVKVSSGDAIAMGFTDTDGNETHTTYAGQATMSVKVYRRD